MCVVTYFLTRLQRSYAADYLGFVLLLTAYLFIVATVEPFHRMFSLDNLAIQYPHATVERVSVCTFTLCRCVE